MDPKGFAVVGGLVVWALVALVGRTVAERVEGIETSEIRWMVQQERAGVVECVGSWVRSEHTLPCAGNPVRAVGKMV